MPTRDTTDTDDTWLGFVLSVTGDDRQAEIAANSGLTQATISRWLSGNQPHAESVILFARGYGVNPVVALVAAGLITKAEADMPRDAAQTIADLSTARIIAELARRDRATEVVA